MNKQDADKNIASYVKKLFGFAMSRLSKIDEAEELVAIWGEQTLRMKYGGKATCKCKRERQNLCSHLFFGRIWLDLCVY